MNLTSSTTERKLLLCALEHPNPKVRNVVLADTSTEDFGTEIGAEIRSRMDSLLQQGKDLGRAVDFAEDPGLSKEAKAFIKATPQLRKAARGASKERILKQLSILRLHKRVRVAFNGLKKASDLLGGKVREDEIDQFCSTLEETLMGVKEGFDRQPLLHLGKGQSSAELKKLIKRLTVRKPGQYIDCGLEALNYYYHGFKRGNVVTLSGNSGGGKTTVALNMATNMVKAGYNVCYVGMEMTEEESLFRIASEESGVEHDIIRLDEPLNPKVAKKIGKGMKRFFKQARKAGSRLTIWDVKDSTFTPQQMEVALRPFNFDVIIVDYITLFYSKHLDVWKMQMEYSRYIKGMAKRMNCVCVVLTQLNDDEQIKYGKSIKENTDYWFWWKYGEEEEQDGETEMHCGKARHAKKRNITLVMKLDVMKVTSKSDDVVDSGPVPTQTKLKEKQDRTPAPQKRRGRRREEQSTDF